MVLVTRRSCEMPFTVVTLKSVPPSLRGDLTKWMQEIATGVYIGNFNSRIREKLWNRIQANVGEGEATISYYYRNEIGYQFDTINSQKSVVDFDGIPLVLIPNAKISSDNHPKLGYSNAAKSRKIKRYSSYKEPQANSLKPYVVIDIETDGLDEKKNTIIEIGAVKFNGQQVEEFNALIKYEEKLPTAISKLTGISKSLLDQEGRDLKEVLSEFLLFIGNLTLVGYNIHFDIQFINNKLNKFGLPILINKTHDIMRYVKDEKLFLDNYQLQTALKSYGIEDSVPHRALKDARLIYHLSTKVNKFLAKMKEKS